MENYIKPQIEIIEIEPEQAMLNYSRERLGYYDDNVDYSDR